VHESRVTSEAGDGGVELKAALTALLGAGHVHADDATRRAYSADIAGVGVPPELVVAPGTFDELRDAVRECTRRGRALVPMGGGWSYTGGYLCVRERSVLVDLRRLDRIVEVNAEDSYVTVEAGCTWKQVYDAVTAHGVRTPYFGPISGYASTVGGALSQGGFFLGSTQHGTSAESTLGLEVVLADGSRLVTGSGATRHAPSPFFRTAGPDLTGLFLGDSGALGIKARATLRLVPLPACHRYASFSIVDAGAVLRVLSEVARRGLAADCYAWDPTFVKSLAARDVTFAQGLEYLRGIVRTGGSVLGGLKDAARVALTGNRYARDATWLLHATVDEANEGTADWKIAEIRAIAMREGGVAVEPSIPRALRGTPFSYPNRILGSAGERWATSHGLCPHSRAPQVIAAFEAHLVEHAEAIAEHRLDVALILFAVGPNTLCVEPLFYWPDARLPSHGRLMQPDFLAKVPEQPPNPAATRAMDRLRHGLVEKFVRLGCVHQQVGKYYPYRDSRDPASYSVLRAIKASLDPQGLMNPGALGLAPANDGAGE
jgi:glycolate oxidase